METCKSQICIPTPILATFSNISGRPKDMGCPYRTHIITHLGPIFFACWEATHFRSSLIWVNTICHRQPVEVLLYICFSIYSAALLKHFNLHMSRVVFYQYHKRIHFCKIKNVQDIGYRGSYMKVHVLVNLLNESSST